MFEPYDPCKLCRNKICTHCTYKALQTNYERALQKIRELSAVIGRPITILVTEERELK